LGGLVEKLVGDKVIAKPVVVVEKITTGVLFDIGVNEWKWIKNGDEKKHGKYVGKIKNGVPNGQGYFKSSGTSFEGKWIDGKPFLGLRIYSSGNKYEGEHKDGKRHGQGIFTWKNGNKYVGEWRDNKEHGQGTFTWKNGNKYVGEFKQSKKHGQGTETFSNGDKYEGKFKDGKPNGQGKLTTVKSENDLPMIVVGEFKGYNAVNAKIYDLEGVLRGEFINGKFIKP
jgi:hypothetical protein